MRNTHVGRAALFIVVASLAPLFASCEKSGMNQSIEDLQPHQEWGDDSSSHFFDTTHSTTLSTAIIEDTKAERRCFREDRKLDKYHHPQREARRSFFDR